MSYLNPTQSPYPASHTGIDYMISQINARLANLPWINRTFNRAFLLPEERNGQLYRNPRIYSGNGEYFNVMPNDGVDCFSFCIGKGPAGVAFEDYTPGSRPSKFTKPLDLIVFGNLKKIDASRDYPYQEELNEAIIGELSLLSGVLINNIHSDDIRDVYADFDLSEIERDFLYYPHFGLRYELEVSYPTNLGGGFPPTNELNCN